MRSFFSKSGSTPTPSAPPTLELGLVASVLRHFPFGAAVRYFPEFKKNIVLESLILGYVLDKDWHFAAQDVVFEGDGNAARLLVGPKRQALRPSSISIIVPSQSRGVEQLDYARREELERTGGLANGNNITLMGPAFQGKTPILETTVRKKSAVQQGLYAGTPVVMLDVNVRSLQLTDQRAYMRLRTRLPANIAIGNETPTPCLLADFSDHSVRLTVDAAWSASFQTRRNVVVSFTLPGRNQAVELQGEIIRHDATDLVINIESIGHNGDFRRLELIDVLEIKAKLLQLPDTSV